ncbi:Transketolase [compost metagenome]
MLESTAEKAREGVKRGGYVVSDAKDGKAVAQLIASGSEVQLAVKAQAALAEEGIHVRVVSLSSWDLFDKQDQVYKDSVILPDVKARVAIEMAHPFGWERYAGEKGSVIGIDTFGASAPGDKVIAEYGFTVENVVKHVKEQLK